MKQEKEHKVVGSERLSREIQVQRAVSKFGLDAEAVERAIDDIARRKQKRTKENVGKSREDKRYLRALDVAAHRFLNAYKNMPQELRASIPHPGVFETLVEIRDHLAPYIEPGQPRRGDGYEKHLAAWHALRLLAQRARRKASAGQIQDHKLDDAEWHQLTALLYGTGKAATVERACRSIADSIASYGAIVDEIIEYKYHLSKVDEAPSRHSSRGSKLPHISQDDALAWLSQKLDQFRVKWNYRPGSRKAVFSHEGSQERVLERILNPHPKEPPLWPEPPRQRQIRIRRLDRAIAFAALYG